MAYSNHYKLGNGATVSIAGTLYEDAESIGIPNNRVDLVDITNLGSTRKEFAVSDMPDSDEIEIVIPNGSQGLPTLATSSSSAVTVIIVLPKISNTLAFTGHVTNVARQEATVDGRLLATVTIKPVSVIVVA